LPLAREAGRLRGLYGIKTPDSAIAAAALLTGTQLITRNVRDFKPIPELALREI
jgi:predicted nucleic acid-binding protein